MEVDVIIGAHMMIRKSVLDVAGVFDSDFFLYLEESELSYRIQKQGYKIYSIPNAHITHFWQQSSKDSSVKLKKDKIKEYYAYSRFVYFEKIYGLKVVKYVYLLTQFWSVLKILGGNKNDFITYRTQYCNYKNNLKARNNS